MFDFFPGKPEWNIQTMRLIAQVPYGGADMFDCMAAVERIQPGDGESWQTEWQKLAEKAESRAQTALADGHEATAMKHYFFASAYYRQSDFFLPGRDPRKRELFLRTNACFQAGAKLHSPVIEPIEVPCADERYAGYFCPPCNPPAEKWPAVLFLGGADSLAEEIFFFGGIELGRRSMALLLVDTPGRASSLRLKNIYSRYDYEVPVKAVIDYLAARPEVDPDRIGLIGVSMAGYYAPRAAAFEKRIKAMVLWCACYSVLDDLYDFYPPLQGQIQWLLGAKNDAEAREKLKDFNLAGVAKQITCPTLVSHGAGDTLMNPQGAVRLFEEISSADKELKIWQGEEGGTVHVNYDNWSISIPFMMDWLAERL